MDQHGDDDTTGRITVSTTQARAADRRGIVLRVLVYSTVLVVVGFILVFYLYFR